MRAAAAVGSGQERQQLVNDEVEEKKEGVVFPQKRVEEAASAVIAALSEGGIQCDNLVPLARTTIAITSVFVEVTSMDDDQKKEIAIRVMNNVIDKEAKSKPNVFQPNDIARIKVTAVACLDMAVKLTKESTSNNQSICCRNCVIL